MTADVATIAAARQLLDQLGITLADLQQTGTGPSIVPTVAEYVDRATTTYIKADLHAVATALQAMTGQPHPLALGRESAHGLGFAP